MVVWYDLCDWMVDWIILYMGYCSKPFSYVILAIDGRESSHLEYQWPICDEIMIWEVCLMFGGDW